MWSFISSIKVRGNGIDVDDILYNESGYFSTHVQHDSDEFLQYLLDVIFDKNNYLWRIYILVKIKESLY